MSDDLEWLDQLEATARAEMTNGHHADEPPWPDDSDAPRDAGITKPELPPTSADMLARLIVTASALENFPPPDPLIDGLLDLDTVTVLYGPSGHFKSFVALDIALSVAKGSWWHRQTTRQGRVLYIAAEGVPGMWERIHAWRTQEQVAVPDDLLFLPGALNLADSGNAVALGEVIAALGVRLLVVDTLARCAVGLDENSARDMGRLVANVDLVRQATGACVLLVHHSGKDAERGMRGSSALFAAADTVLSCSSADDIVTLEITKQKHHRTGTPFTFRPVPVADSIVLSDRTYDPTGTVPESVLKTLDALVSIAIPGGVPTGPWEVSSGVPKSTFYRHRRDLLNLSLVSNVGTDKQPRYLPKDFTDSHGLTPFSQPNETGSAVFLTFSPPFKGENGEKARPQPPDETNADPFNDTTPEP